MSRTGKILMALAMVQAAIFAVFHLVERSRHAEGAFLSESLALAAPPLVFERPEGPVSVAGGRTVVHFWATWCAPCRTELPALLEASSAAEIRVLAATDEPWPVVQRYFDGQIPASIVRDPGGAARTAYQVSGLPDTFVVEDGRIIARVGGPRDWMLPAARRFLQGPP